MGRAFAQHIRILAGGLVLFVTLAHAQISRAAEGRSPAAALHWVRLPGAEDCIRGERLARDVEARLQRPVFAVHDATVLIEGYAMRDDDGHRASLRMSTNDGAVLGQRELSSKRADCRELSETITVVLAIMIDPEAATRTPSVAQPAPAAPEEPAVDEDPARDPRHRLAPFVRGAYGMLPGRAVGIGAAYEFELRRWGSLRVEAVGFFARRDSLGIPPRPGVPSAGALYRVAYGGVAYCPFSVGGAFVQVASCLGMELGVIHSEGFGLTGDTEKRLPWFSGSAALRGSIRVFGEVRAFLGLSVLATRPRQYEVENEPGPPRKIYGQSWVAGTLDLGIGANFSL